MGMDIHSFVGVKNPKDEWEVLPLYKRHNDGDIVFAEAYNNRYTEFFMWLLGRNNMYGDMPYANRGIPRVAPTEIPGIIIDLYDRYDVCNGSYMSLSEMADVVKKMPKHFKYRDEDGNKVKERNEVRDAMKSMINTIISMIALSDTYVNSPDDVRVYYWFDN